MLLCCVCLLNIEPYCAAFPGRPRKLQNLDKTFVHILLVDFNVFRSEIQLSFIYLQVSPGLWKIFSCEFLCLDQTLFPRNLPNHFGGSSGRHFKMPPSWCCLSLPLYLQVFPSIRYHLILQCSILQVRCQSIFNQFLCHLQLLICDITCYFLI